MRTIKSLGVIGGFLALLFLGLFFVNWLLIILSLPLIIILLLSVISFHDEKLNIDVKRKISKEKVYENDEINIFLEIENKGKKINFLEIYDELPKKMKITKGSNYISLSLDRNEKIKLNYSASSKIRGHFRVGPLKLRVNDSFNLFYREEIIENESYVMVLPYLEELKNVPFKTLPQINQGNLLAKNAGIDSEFYGIRKYYPGDSFKNINWKTLARFRNLMVNEFHIERKIEVIIIIDSRQIESMGSISKNPLEYNIKAAGSLATFFLNRRDRVGVIAYGNKEGKLKWIYPESGKKQLYKILEELVKIQAEGEYNFHSMINQASIHMLPKKSVIFFISSLQNDETISEGIEKLIRLGFNTLVLSPSSVDLEFSLHENDEIDEITYRILGFDRKNNISKIQKTGALVIDWNPSLPLIVPLEEVRAFQMRR